MELPWPAAGRTMPRISSLGRLYAEVDLSLLGSETICVARLASKTWSMYPKR